MSAAALALFAELPVHGHYFWDVFPGFLIGGIGMALGFVPLTIGALAGVRPGDAGVASGLVNTAQQVGGAIGVAAATTIAATSTSDYLGAHPGAAADAALTHGFASAFWALAGIAAVAAVLAALVVESAPAPAAAVPEVEEERALEPAA
jgi:MFS family permease